MRLIRRNLLEHESDKIDWIYFELHGVGAGPKGGRVEGWKGGRQDASNKVGHRK